MPAIHFPTLAVAALLSAGAGVVHAATYRVHDLDTLAQIVGQQALPGDVIELEAGTYSLAVDRISVRRSGTSEQPIVIRGAAEAGQRTVIDASQVNVRRCVFAVEPGVHDIIFENLEIKGAAGSRFPDKRTFGVNATAIYFDGCHNVTVRNCSSHHNEDGFFANHGADYILIDHCDVHHNGTSFVGNHNRTHNFYFCAKHQLVKNCYIHDSTEGENFKSRGDNTILAFNWVEEDAIYSIAVDSGGSLNTLWLGNLVAKRRQLGHGQGRLLGVGDGTGRATGKLVAINNTFITHFPRDFYLFTFATSTTDVILINNVFAGTGQSFLRASGSGRVSGNANWIANAAGPIPESLTNSLRGDDPGFMDAAAFDYRLKPTSPLAVIRASEQEIVDAVQEVTGNARSKSAVMPSLAWLAALEAIERPALFQTPVRGQSVTEALAPSGRRTFGAFPLAP